MVGRVGMSGERPTASGLVRDVSVVFFCGHVSRPPRTRGAWHAPRGVTGANSWVGRLMRVTQGSAGVRLLSENRGEPPPAALGREAPISARQ
jgi:hypothetical protein